MGKATSVVEINGHRYDANTGDVIGTVIDGFIRKKRPAKLSAQAKKEPVKTHVYKSAAKARPAGKSAKGMHKRAERSHTLLRSAVAKPSGKLKRAGTNIVKTSARPAIAVVDNAKLTRAKLIEKHSKVERFGTGTPQKIEDTPKKILSGEIINAKTNLSGETKTAPAAPVMPSMVASASHHRLERMLDEALLRADAHKRAADRRSKRWLGLPKWLSILIVAIVLLGIIGIVVWENVPAVAVKAAAIRSHVDASVPAYTPAGFSFSQATSQPDKVSLKYKEGTNPQQTYTITQQNSSWDSQTLSDNSMSKQSQVQTSQVDGTTVYIYGPNSNATWVNNGSLYTIQNNAKLSSDQLLQIVQGM